MAFVSPSLASAAESLRAAPSAGDPQHVLEALRAFGRGEIVVVTDDDGRENEGDLIVAAVHCTAAQMAFIVRHTSGIVCAPLTQDIARRLDLPAMVARNDAPHATAFTVSVDFRHGTTTGISAADRTLTVRKLADSETSAADFVRPGHLFPLVAREGGVLTRSGHTEAAVDLCRLSGLPPVGVICELVNDDGTVMRGAEVAAFAGRHGLRRISVADLIAHRQRKERLVARAGTSQVATGAGPATVIGYRLPWNAMQHLALVYGDISGPGEVVVHLHHEQAAEDVFGGRETLGRAMHRIAASGRGVLVYLRTGSAGVGHAPHPLPGEDHPETRAREEAWREIGLGAQILRDLGVGSIRLLGSGDRHAAGLAGFGLTVTATEPI